MSCRSSVLGLLILSAVWWAGAPSEAQAVYTLQFGPFATRAEVEAVEEILDAESMPQATSASDGVTTTVMVGCFEYVADAYVARKAIDPENDFDASVVALAEQRDRQSPRRLAEATRLPRPVFQKPDSQAQLLPFQLLPLIAPAEEDFCPSLRSDNGPATCTLEVA